ncbi:MAG: sigma-54-dependent Fis family transcriptional regulator, partial [Desulfobacterales bacterium]|nr:sigma-54-dependent Fis family transcriptional regulator [Desulfobacterales bacterium]
AREVNSEFRLICATHRDVQALLKSGQMRNDFFYRISVMPIHIPPLRERGDDIILLARRFLRRFSHEISKPIEDFTPAAYRLLNRHNWSGNVRELMNVIERAVMVGNGPKIDAKDLSFLESGPAAPTQGASLKEVEAKHIRQTLEDCGWNISRAAEVLEIDRGTLARHMKKHGIVKPR